MSSLSLIKDKITTLFQYRLIVRAGGYEADILNDGEFGEEFVQIRNDHMTDESFITTQDLAYAHDKIIQDRNLAFFGPRDEIVANVLGTRRSCDVKIAWESNFPLFLSIALQKSSPYYPFLRRSLQKMAEYGPLNVIKSRWNKKLPHCPSPPVSAMNIEKIFTLFLLIVLGSIVAMILLVCEIIWQPKPTVSFNPYSQMLPPLLKAKEVLESLEEHPMVAEKLDDLLRILSSKDKTHLRKHILE